MALWLSVLSLHRYRVDRPATRALDAAYMPDGCPSAGNSVLISSIVLVDWVLATQELIGEAQFVYL